MENKELLEYRQKIKGLSLKELNDILTHINREKLPEKHAAIQEEITLRTGIPAPAAVAAPAAVKQKPEEVASAPSAPAAASPPAAAKPVTAPKNPLDKALTLLSMVLLLAALYFLLIPFVSLPGVEALRAMLG